VITISGTFHCNFLNVFSRYNLGERMLLILLIAASFVYIFGIIGLVTISDQKNNGTQVCTKQTFYLQQVLYYFNKEKVF
jgi:hypothetical protein